MKVIFVIVSMAGGGAERVISILANRFVKQGIQVTIMMTAGDEVAYPLDERILLAPMGGTSGGSFRKRLQRIKKMRRVFKEQRDAVIISFGPGTSFFAVAAALFLKHKFIISERNDPAACEHPHLRNLVYNRAAKIIFQTAAAAGCFPKRLQRKGCVIGNPVNSKLPEVYEGKRDKRIVAVGRLEPQKNHRLLLDAFSLFSKENKAYTLHLYGNGSLKKELQGQARQLGIEEKVILEGFQEEIMEKIKDGAMYVLSSDYEGISNALLEAMAMGMPVISTDCPIGGSAQCIRDKENGLLVPVGDEEALYAAMKEIAEDVNLAARIGREAARVRETYSEETITSQWIDVLIGIG